MNYIDYINEVVKPQKEPRGFRFSEKQWENASSKFAHKREIFGVHIGNRFWSKRDLIITHHCDDCEVELSFDFFWGRGMCIEVSAHGLRHVQWY